PSEEIRSWSEADRNSAARRFLELPFASAWWRSEFSRRTGFEQFRDGRVPSVRTCRLVFDRGVEVEWQVEIFSMTENDWVQGPAAPFRRPVAGADRLTLRDCG